jgi:hypothetical protein
VKEEVIKHFLKIAVRLEIIEVKASKQITGCREGEMQGEEAVVQST